jgi:hypothetical protein
MKLLTFIQGSTCAALIYVLYHHHAFLAVIQ